MDKQPSEKRFALLIDADNVSAKYIKPITDELSNYGTVTIKRIYGDWTLSLHAKWKDALLENSLTPIQQFGYTQGKNATDSAMIIDAMDILYTGSVEGFCIVSSDSDFTRLASRLRESGRMVIGMGEKKTPTPFRRACDVFTTLELLLDDANGKRKGKETGSGPSIEEVEQAVVRIITDNQNNGKATGLGEVGSRLLKRFPDFDVRSYGTNLLSKLLSKFSSVTITRSGSDVSVELADDKEPAKAKRERGDAAEQAAPSPSGDMRPHEDESSDQAEEGDRAAGAEPAGDAGDAASGARRRKRRSGSPRRKIRPKRSEDEPSGEDASAPEAAEDAVGDAASRSAFEDADAPSAAGLSAGGEDAATQSAPSEAASVESEGAQEAADERAEEKARVRKGAKEPARRGGRKTSRRKAGSADAASDADAVPTAEEKPAAEEPASAGKQAASFVGSTPAVEAAPAAGRRRGGKRAVSGDRAKAARSGGTDLSLEVGATTRRLVAEAGPDGIDVSELASRVRVAHRSFKVRDLGYAQFRTYVAHLGDIEVEREGRQWIARMGE